MERGGFHGYQRLHKSNSAPNHSESFDDNSDRDLGCTVREQDRYMPIANVIRIMRKILPTHAKISDDAKETIQECVSEYISFVTSEANDRCRREQRKTVTAEDVLWAMSKLGFDDYVEPLGVYLQRYREVEGDHRGSIRGEPFLKRVNSEVGFHVVHHQQQVGFGGAGVMGGGGGYFTSGSGSSSAMGGSFDPYVSYK